MTVGMGAVCTTLIAGVEAVRKGLAKPIGSLTQMGTIRLGKRTDANSPLMRDFLPLAKLDDLVFTGWDIFGGNLYDAAKTAEVLDKETLEKIRPYLESIEPMPAAFDQHYVKRLTGTRIKSGKNKRDLAEQTAQGHPGVQEEDRPAGGDLDRIDRDIPGRRRRCTRRWRRSRRGWRTTIRGSRRRSCMRGRR